jgi:hypothetical protein
MPKSWSIVAFACALTLAVPGSALAVDGDDDPGEGGPTSTPVLASLTVTPPGGGSITGTGISCPGDCTQAFNYTRTCESGLPDSCTDDAQTIRLTASRGAGWEADWTGCTSEPAANQCDVKVVSQNQPVSLTWVDTANPTVSFSETPALAGPSTVFGAVASDNASVASVRFYVAGPGFAGDTLINTVTAAPYRTNLAHGLQLFGYTHGGSYTIKAVAVDTSGRVSSDLATAPSHAFTVDREAPLTVSSVPAYVNAPPQLTITPPSDVASVTCRWLRDNILMGTLSSCASPYTPPLALEPDGNYRVDVSIVDQVGNLNSVSRAFTLDRVAPSLALSAGPDEDAVITDSTPSFGFTASDANPITLLCKVEPAAFEPCDSATGHEVDALSAGDHTFVVRAQDGAGNNSPDVVRHFSVDLEPPTVSHSNPATVAGPATVFTASAQDDNELAEVRYYVDGVLKKTDTSAPFAADLELGGAAYSHGASHALKLVAVDTAGRESGPLSSAPSHTFTVDKQTAFASTGNLPALTNTAPSLAFTLPSDATSAGVTCRTQRAGAPATTTTSCTPPYAAQIGPSSPDGDYTLELSLVDAVGNEATVSRSFELDRTSPSLSITGGPADGAQIQGPSASFNFTASDSNGVTLSCKNDSGDFGSCGGSDNHAMNGLAPGSHTFTLRAVDGAGNTTQASRTFTVESPTTTTTTTTNTNTNTTPGGSAPPGQGEVRNAAAAARSGPRWAVRGGKTRVSKFVLTGLARGVAVDVACKGRGCPFKAKKLRAAGAKLDITKLFKKRQLRAGTVIEVRVTFADGSVRTFRYTTQKGKKKPKAETL